MLSPGLINEIKIHVFNGAKCTVGQEWNYSNIVSPFSRIYLMEEGEGFILPNNKMIQLKPGYMYLIPSYTHCSYHCTTQMTQYYLHFAHYLPHGLKIFDQMNVVNEVKAMELDYHLFNRLLQINPTIPLRRQDPNIYEKDKWFINTMEHRPNHIQLETEGIIKQLFSRFIQTSSQDVSNIKEQSFIKKIFAYISNHLSEDIKVENMAALACYSTDHFARQFKKITGLRPMEFINRKRVEKAQELLITTTLSQRQISEEVGFNSQQYYTRIFKQICKCTPEQYRRMGGLI